MKNKHKLLIHPQVLKLSGADTRLLSAALDRPATANAKLKAASDRYEATAPELAEFNERYVKILVAAVGLFDGNEKEALRWLRNPVKALGNKRPVDMLSNDADTQIVLNVIGRLEHGVFT